MKKRYTGEQIIGFLKEADAGVPVKELCRRHGFSDASYYLWRAKFGGMDVSDAKRLKALEAENAKRKKISVSDRQPLVRPDAANHVWSMDFVFDRVASGRALKCLAIVDDATHESVAVAPEHAIGGHT